MCLKLIGINTITKGPISHDSGENDNKMATFNDSTSGDGCACWQTLTFETYLFIYFYWLVGCCLIHLKIHDQLLFFVV